MSRRHIVLMVVRRAEEAWVTPAEAVGSCAVGWETARSELWALEEAGTVESRRDPRPGRRGRQYRWIDERRTR